MTVMHVVLFPMPPDADKAKVRNMLQGLNELKQIPGVRKLTFGENYSPRHKGYTHALVVELDSKHALENYGPHPAHQNVVAKFIQPVVSLDKLIVVDYEV